MNAFDVIYWNLTQSLAWIWFQDKTLVQESSDARIAPWCVYTRKCNPHKKTRHIIATRPLNLPAGGPPVHLAQDMFPEELKKETDNLLTYLKSGKITAYGRANDMGDKIPIPDLYWADGTIDIFSYPPVARPCEDHAKATEWHDIFLKRKTVVKRWPEKPISKKRTTPSKEEMEKVIYEIAKEYRTNDKNINRDTLYTEVNTRLLSGHATHELTDYELQHNESLQDLRLKQGQRGLSKHKKA